MKLNNSVFSSFEGFKPFDKYGMVKKSVIFIVSGQNNGRVGIFAYPSKNDFSRLAFVFISDYGVSIDEVRRNNPNIEILSEEEFDERYYIPYVKREEKKFLKRYDNFLNLIKPNVKLYKMKNFLNDLSKAEKKPIKIDKVIRKEEFHNVRSCKRLAKRLNVDPETTVVKVTVQHVYAEVKIRNFEYVGTIYAISNMLYNNYGFAYNDNNDIEMFNDAMKLVGLEFYKNSPVKPAFVFDNNCSSSPFGYSVNGSCKTEGVALNLSNGYVVPYSLEHDICSHKHGTFYIYKVLKRHATSPFSCIMWNYTNEVDIERFSEYPFKNGIFSKDTEIKFLHYLVMLLVLWDKEIGNNQLEINGFFKDTIIIDKPAKYTCLEDFKQMLKEGGVYEEAC
jgi:hypothetical protein